MKERKRNVFGVRRILSAVFAVGFVVALLSTINAFAAANLFKIQNAELSDLSAGVTGAISTFDETNIESNVTFHKLDDTAKYTITLKNTDSKDHIIESITDDNDNPYVSYEYSSYANTIIKAGESFDFVVTAKYANAVTDKNARAQATNVKFFLQFTDIEEPEVIPITPNTGDNIAINVTILAVSAAGLIVCAAIAIKRNKKTAKYLAVVIAAVAAVAVTAGVKAATVEINSISITSNYGLYDKSVVTWTDVNGDEHEEFVPYNEPANIQDPDKPGYTFTGWEDEDGNPVDPSEPVTGDIKIHPTYRANKYTIKFDGNGATGSMDSIEMTYDEAKTLPANTFIFAGRTYMGWDTEANGSGVHHDDRAEVKNLTTEDNGIVTLYAQWSVNPFFINYDGNGATSGEMATTNCEYDQSCILRDNAFSKPGYHFIGWKYNNTDYANKADVKNIIESGTITMVAQWAVNHYTIVFDINTDDLNASGDMADMANLEYDRDYTLTANAFTRTGYNFGGWNTEIDGRNFGLTDEQEFHNLTTTDNAVITLYAQWTPTRYTIIFHANNENVENPDAMAAQVVTYDIETTLNPIAYTWWQHKLVEWTTNANGTGTKYADKATIKNLNANGGEVHLYAKWREIDAALDGRGNLSNKNITNKLKAITIANPDAKNFLHYPNGEPSDEIKASATDLSGTIDPIYAWAEGENIYWWSEDVKPRISTNNSVEYHYYGVGKNTAEGKVNNLEYMDLTGFDTTGIVGARSPFEYTNIRRADISDWDLSNATDMGYFAYNAQLTEIIFPEEFDVQKVTNVAMAFNGARIVNLDLSSWKTRDLRNASSFINMKTVEEVKFSSDFSTANVTTMAGMFANSSKLTSLNLSMFDTANVQNMSGMFNGVSNMTTLDISNFNTGAVTSMGSMFANMTKLETLTVGSNFTAASVTDMSSIFVNDTSLTSLDLSSWGATNSLANLNRAFSGMTNLATLDLTGWDLSGVNNLDHTFHQTRNIETIYASSDTVPSKFTEDNLKWTFEYATPKIVGGAGSTGSLGMNGVHSRIDDPDNNAPGYFTMKDARYIRYHDNDGDDTNDEANYALMPSYYVSTAEPYDVKLRTNAFEKEHYKFMGWATSADGEVVYADGAALEGVAASKNPLDLYAVWKERSAMLDTGANVNVILRNLAEAPTSFSRYNGTPNFETIEGEQDIALPDSIFPVYAWYDEADQAIYWWSEADKPTMNVNSAKFFNGVHNAGTASAPNNVVNSLSKLESIDMTGLDASAAKDMTRLFADTKALNSLNLSDFDSSSATNMDGMFAGTALKNVDLSLIEAGNVTSMASMFQSTKFNALDFSNFDTHNVKLMSNMFTSAVMTNLDLSTLDTSSVTNMANMFKSSNITTLTFFDADNPTATKFDTSKVTTISEMFRESKTKTLDLSQFNTSAVTSMYGVFYSAAVSDLNVSNWDTSNVTSMYIMFFAAANLTSLNLSHFNTAKVTNMQQMFDSTTKLKYLNVSNWSNDKVANMSYMFQDVGRGTAGEVTIVFDGFKTPSVTNMTRMFARYNDHNLKVLDLSSFDTSKVTSMGTMFGGGRQDTMIHNAMFDTIYVSDKFTNAGVSPTTEVFNRTSTVIGGAGTTWSQDHMTADYARIDDPDNGKPGYFTIKGTRYIRYHDNDGDTANDETNYALMTSEYLKAGGSLTKNAFVRDGYVFTGWKDADNNEYTDEQVMADLTESKTPLELYAQWDAAPYTVTFNANGGEVLQSAKTATYLQPYSELPTPVRYDYANGMLGSKYGFKEWNTKADGTGDTITQSSIYANTDDTTLYAIWNDEFTVTIYNGESETPTIASYGVDDIVYLNAQNVAGKQFLYWEVDGAKKSYTKDYSMRIFQGKDLTIRAVYGSESDLESQQPGAYISDIYRRYSDNKIVVRSYSYVPDEYEIVKAGVIATFDANIANGTFDDQTATYPRAESVNGSNDNYYFTWSKKDVTSEQTVYVKAYLIYKDADGVEYTIYGDLVTATLTE
ncbi:BspA family leucine-rich repeat surface protein [Candidatus Saccharibacteria bacterium]|nr:BspA family leucine-rich repeat surface protein [Candidatus Saccharibacteria bacterium]